MNPVSDSDSSSISSTSDTESIKEYSDYEDEMEDKFHQSFPTCQLLQPKTKNQTLRKSLVF